MGMGLRFAIKCLWNGKKETMHLTPLSDDGIDKEDVDEGIRAT